ncbi:class IV adenylate cyclase [Pseudonocardia acaciae]|uniref:class IV adenylate cyclase n=1 Tax=Pseudonocardia acaciae TaxID=551276 RepID=UPI00048FB4E0|nr:class IV adenylate cyclase [Pseudonocardia acaciae]
MATIEAELKAVVRDPDRLNRLLANRADSIRSTYADRYFDFPDRRFTEQGRELRVRTVTDDTGERRVLLTYKEPAVDDDSGSKPEHETTAAEADVLVTVLTTLGVEEVISFEKRCVNYRFSARGWELLATVVTVPELAGKTFIELETAAHPDDVDAALRAVKAVLGELGIGPGDYTREAYTDAVAAQRG